MMEDFLRFAGLFFSAFVSSTIAPGGSEAVLAVMVSENRNQVGFLVGIATIGNTLGALTTWFLGYLAAKKYPVESLLESKKQKSIIWVRKWGQWPLLLSWLPIVGDGFCFAGGWLRMPLYSSVAAIFIGKLMRYVAISWAFAGS